MPHILPLTRPSKPEDALMVEDESIYHGKAGEFLSSHLLGTFDWCPLVYHLTVSGAYSRPDSFAYSIGRATHCLVLEGRDEYHKRYNSCSPTNPTTGKPYGSATKKYESWASEVVACGQEPISASDEELAFKIAKSVNSHKLASEKLSQALYRERVIRTSCMGVDCQSRMDAFGFDVGIVDFKTCENLDKLIYQAKSFGYIKQLAFYRMVARASGNTNPPITSGIGVPATYIIGAEKKFPYRCGVWRIEESSLDLAESEIQTSMTKLCKCQESGKWPTGWEELRVMMI